MAPLSSAQLDRTWVRIEAELANATEGPRPVRKRRMRVLLGGVVTAMTLGAGGVAVAAVYSAHTGRGPLDAEDKRLGGPGERLDPSAPDYSEVLARTTKDVPFPSDRDRDSFLQAEASNDRNSDAMVSTGALRYWAARSAVCAWADQWAEARASGDATAKAQAATMLEGAPEWPVVTAIDSRQRITHRYIDVTGPDGTTTRQLMDDSTAAAYFPLLSAAARTDDIHAMAATLSRWGACGAYGAAMPHLPEAAN